MFYFVLFFKLGENTWQSLASKYFLSNIPQWLETHKLKEQHWD